MGFILRNILADHVRDMPDKKSYQKALAMGWIWFTLVITCAYAGNLMAMITRPTLVIPMQEPVDLLNQNEISLVMEDGTAQVDYMRKSPPQSTMSKIFDKIELLEPEDSWPSGCFSNYTQSTGRHASLCDTASIKMLLHDSFSKTGQCDWYITETSVLKSEYQVMLIQVVNVKGFFLM